MQGLAIVACAVVALPSAVASLMRALDLAELTAGADQIVIGDVLSTASAWDSAHRNIHSTIEVAVKESWKGMPPADGKITIRQLGGTVGDIEMTVYGMPHFAPGERALLFLRKSRVVGMGQGKRRVHWDATSDRWLVDAPAGSGTVMARTRANPRSGEPGEPDTLDRMREKIRALVGK